jgi:hypothetical protein
MAEAIRASGPLVWQKAASRRGLVNVVLPYSVFADQWWGFGNLFDDWGGEALGWLSGPEVASLEETVVALRTRSRPVIVEVAVDPGLLTATGWSIWPVMCAVLIGLDEPSAQWAIRERLRVLDLIFDDDARWPVR